MPSDFAARARAVQAARRSLVCVGLDPDLDRLPASLTAAYAPADALAHFCAAIVEATAGVACAYKPNLAFFEPFGAEGWRALAATVAAIRRLAPEALVIADAKRGDIGNTARRYAEALYDGLGCDACTVAPYMGHDSVLPFLQHPGRCAFVLGRTSNPGAADFQEADCGGEALYRRVMRAVARWGTEAPGTAGLVVGATAPAALDEAGALAPGLPLLLPGVGAQGGDLEAVRAAAREGALLFVNSSRQILYADAGPGFAEAAGRAAEALRAQLGPPTP